MEVELDMPPSGQQHRVEYLFDRLNDVVTDYPADEVIRVPERITGTAFFPGGYGLWRGEGPGGGSLPCMPCGGVMVLGQDFHSKHNYEKSRSRRNELYTPTWRNLRDLLKCARIRVEECFFTNAYMGLRADNCSKGRSPGAKKVNSGFRRQCRSFFLEQIAEQEPGLILVLGLEVAKFIASDQAEWEGWRRTWRDLDNAGPLRHGVRFDPAALRATSVAALVHPSMRQANFGRNPELRHYEGLSGDAAERAILREAVDIFRKG